MTRDLAEVHNWFTLFRRLQPVAPTASHARLWTLTHYHYNTSNTHPAAFPAYSNASAPASGPNL
jgi:hypothetical protein